MLDICLGVMKFFMLWMLFEAVGGLQGVFVSTGLTGLG